MTEKVQRNTFYKRQVVADALNINANFKDLPNGTSTTLTLGNTINKNFAALETTVPDNPPYGAGELVGGYLSLFNSDLSIKSTSRVPNLVGYLLNSDYDLTEASLTIAPKGDKVTIINSIPDNPTPIMSEDFDGDTSLGYIPRMVGNAVQNLNVGYLEFQKCKALFEDLGIYTNKTDFDRFTKNAAKVTIQERSRTQVGRVGLQVLFSADRRTFKIPRKDLTNFQQGFANNMDRVEYGTDAVAQAIVNPLLRKAFPNATAGSIGALDTYYDHNFDTRNADQKGYLNYLPGTMAGPDLDSSPNANENNTIFNDIYATIDNTNAFEATTENPLILSNVELSTEKSLNGGQSLRLYHNWGYSAVNSTLQNSLGVSGNLNPQVIRASIYNIPAPAYPYDASQNTLSADEPLPGISGNMSTIVPEISMGINISKLAPMITLNLSGNTEDFNTITDYVNDATPAATNCSAFENTFLRSVVVTFSNYKPLPEHTTVDKFLDYGLSNFYSGKEYDNIVGGVVFTRYGIDGGAYGPKNEGDNIIAYPLPVAAVPQRTGTSTIEYTNKNTGMAKVAGSGTGELPNLDKLVWGYQDINDTNFAADDQLRYCKLPTNGWFTMRTFIDMFQANNSGSFVKRIYAPSSSANPSFGSDTQRGAAMRVIFETNEANPENTGVPSASGSSLNDSQTNLQFLDIGFPVGDSGGAAGTNYPEGGTNYSFNNYERYYPKHMTIWVNNYRWVEGANTDTPTGEELNNPFLQGDNAITANGANMEAEVYIDNILFKNFAPEINNATAGVGNSNIVLKPRQHLSPRTVILSGTLGDGTTSFPAWSNKAWVRSTPLALTTPAMITTGSPIVKLNAASGSIDAIRIENNGRVDSTTGGSNYSASTALGIAMTGTGIPANSFVRIVDANTLNIIDVGNNPVNATATGRTEITFSSSGTKEPYYNIANYYKYNTGQNLLFGFNEKTDLPMPLSGDNVGEGYLLFNNFHTMDYDNLKNSPIANDGATAFKNKYLATNAGALLSMTDTNEATDQLGATMFTSRYVSGTTVGSNNLSGSAFLVTGGESDNAISLRTGTTNFLNNDGFRQKGFIRVNVSGNSGTPNPSNWGKREHVAASVKVMSIAAVNDIDKNVNNDIALNQIKVSDTNIFNYDDPDETYVIYVMGGNISSTADADRYRITGLKLDRTTRPEDNIITFTTSLQYANDTNTVLFSEENLPWLWISPEKYWITILFDSPADMIPRTYENICTVNTIPTAGNTSGTTFNESLYSYDASTIATGGAAALNYNSWDLNPSGDNNTLVLDRDLGYGAYDDETNLGGQALVGKIKYSSYNNFDISPLVRNNKAGDNIPLLLTSDSLLTDTTESATFYSDDYTSDTNKVPMLFWKYYDAPPVLSNLRVSGPIDIDAVDLYNLQSENLSSVNFNWTEDNADDVWYRLLMVSESGSIDDKYHSSTMWIPLNESDVDMSTAPSYTVHNPSAQTSGNCTVGSTVRTRIDGQGGYAPVLNTASTGKVTVPTATNTGMKDLSEYTLVVHYTPSTADKGNTRYIVTQADDMATADGNFFMFKNSSDKIVVRQGVATFLTGASTITCNDSVPTSVIVRYDSGSTSEVKCELYINGVLEASSINGQNVTGSNDFVVGGRFQTGYSGTTGRVEEVVLYNKAHEIAFENSYVYNTRDLEEIDGNANQSFNARVFAADYHNFRGNGPQSIGMSNQVSWRPTTV